MNNVLPYLCVSVLCALFPMGFVTGMMIERHGLPISFNREWLKTRKAKKLAKQSKLKGKAIPTDLEFDEAELSTS